MHRIKLRRETGDDLARRKRKMLADSSALQSNPCDAPRYAMPQSETLDRSLFENSLDAIFLTRANGMIPAANQAACTMFGMTEEDICHLGYSGLADQDDPRHIAAEEQCAQAGRFKGELTYVRKDGTKFPAEVSSVILDDGSRSFVILRDITEYKRNEDAIKESREQLQQANDLLSGIVNNTSDLIVALDTKFQIMTLNEVFRKGCETVLGIHVQVGVNLVDALAQLPEDREKVIKHFGRAFHGETVVATEAFGDAIRSQKFFDLRISPIRDAAGNIVGAAHFARDVTDRVKTAERLQNSERQHRELAANLEIEESKLKAILDSLPVGLWIADATGKMLLVNDYASSILGGEVPLANTVSEYTHYALRWSDTGEPIAAADMPLARSLKGEICKNLAVDFEHSDGTRFIQLVSSAPIKTSDGAIIGGVAVVQDITDRKRSEESLRESEALYRGLFEHMFEGYAYCRMIFENNDLLDCVFLAVNESYEPLTGLKDVVGKRASEVIPGLRKSNPELLALYGRVSMTGIPEKCETYIEPLKSWLSISVYSLKKGYFITVFDNITERKQIEEALAVSHEKLEQRVKDRTAELTQTVSELHQEVQNRIRIEKALEQERQALEHLLQSSDHERQLIAYEIHDGLAQILTGAIMQFQAYPSLKDIKPKQATKAYDTGMKLLQQGHFEARRLINGVRPPILDESGVVSAIAHLVQEQHFQEGPKIEFRSSVEFDRLNPIAENSIYRIVQEALSNARQHSKSEKVRVEMVQSGDRLRIEIQDWGVGFGPDTVKEGHFGLEGIRQRARTLGGTVVIDSPPGKGTRLEVELPLYLNFTASCS